MAPQVWPAGWQLREFNPAHVARAARVMGRRTVKTDAVDLEAMTELLLAGRGQPVPQLTDPVAEPRAWVTHRDRRVITRMAVKNQLSRTVHRPGKPVRVAVAPPPA